MQTEQRALIRRKVDHSNEPFVEADVTDMLQRKVMHVMRANQSIETVQNLGTAGFQRVNKVVLFLQRNAQLDDDQETDKHLHYVMVVLCYLVVVAEFQTANF